jgi:hypothetical protein
MVTPKIDLVLVECYSTQSIPDGSIDFFDTVRVIVKASESGAVRNFNVPIYSLEYFQKMSDLAVISVAKAFVMSVYSLELIKENVLKIIHSCQGQPTLREAAQKLDSFMVYEMAHENDSWLNEQHDFERYGYKIIQKQLETGGLYPDDITSCSETVLLTLRNHESGNQINQKITIVTVPWLEQELAKNQILYLKKAYVRWFFDYGDIQV